MWHLYGICWIVTWFEIFNIYKSGKLAGQVEFYKHTEVILDRRIQFIITLTWKLNIHKSQLSLTCIVLFILFKITLTGNCWGKLEISNETESIFFVVYNVIALYILWIHHYLFWGNCEVLCLSMMPWLWNYYFWASSVVLNDLPIIERGRELSLSTMHIGV